MTSNPQWKYRRLAARALRILERTQALDTTLTAYNTTLKPAAEAYIKSYDRLRVLTKRRATEHREGKLAIHELARSVRAWAGQIQALDVVKNLSVGDYINTPDVPDDVIADAQAFMELLNDHDEVNPETVPYIAELREDMNLRLAKAELEWSEAEVASEEWQELVETNRTAQKALNAQLIAFRRNLAAIVGTKHPAYQSLRSSRISRMDQEDGADIDLEAPYEGDEAPRDSLDGDSEGRTPSPPEMNDETRKPTNAPLADAK